MKNIPLTLEIPIYTEMCNQVLTIRPLVYYKLTVPTEGEFYSNNGMLMKMLEGLREIRHVVL